MAAAILFGDRQGQAPLPPLPPTESLSLRASTPAATPGLAPRAPLRPEPVLVLPSPGPHGTSPHLLPSGASSFSLACDQGPNEPSPACRGSPPHPQAVPGPGSLPVPSLCHTLIPPSPSPAAPERPGRLWPAHRGRPGGAFPGREAVGVCVSCPFPGAAGECGGRGPCCHAAEVARSGRRGHARTARPPARPLRTPVLVKMLRRTMTRRPPDTTLGSARPRARAVSRDSHRPLRRRRRHPRF